MNKTYRLRYENENDYFKKKVNSQIPFSATVVSTWIILTILFIVFLCINKFIPLALTITTLVLSLLALAVLLIAAVYHCYHWYNNSITEVHWDFDQEITISGNQVLSKVTSGEDTFTEVLFIRKTIKKKDYTIYYQDSHHYVIIPDGISPVSEEEANHL